MIADSYTRNNFQYPKAYERDYASNDVSKYNPFENRAVSMGFTIFAMPYVFGQTGYIAAFVLLPLTGVGLSATVYGLLKIYYRLLHRHRIPILTYSQMAAITFQNGPPLLREISTLLEIIIESFQFLSSYALCSIYMKFIGQHLAQFATHYQTVIESNRLWILMSLAPVFAVCLIPAFSMLSLIGILLQLAAIIIAYVFHVMVDLPDINSIQTKNNPFLAFALAFVLFEGITSVIPLENKMKHPERSLYIMPSCIFVLTAIYTVLGFLGFWKYGTSVKPFIVLNFSLDSGTAQASNILATASVLCTYPMQFNISFHAFWECLKPSRNERSFEICLRLTLLVGTRTQLLLGPAGTAYACIHGHSVRGNDFAFFNCLRGEPAAILRTFLYTSDQCPLDYSRVNYSSLGSRVYNILLLILDWICKEDLICKGSDATKLPSCFKIGRIAPQPILFSGLANP
uniref:Amino acid transporter transmembrane domain-containing protein n=1 Tax=Glossina brevipalpis TaxID=37001 RepID=A0A1A9W4E3_9MUSC